VIFKKLYGKRKEGRSKANTMFTEQEMHLQDWHY